MCVKRHAKVTSKGVFTPNPVRHRRAAVRTAVNTETCTHGSFPSAPAKTAKGVHTEHVRSDMEMEHALLFMSVRVKDVFFQEFL